jgi:uncharacterized damage-inducible protein DinB
MSGQIDLGPRVYRVGLALHEDGAEAVVFDLPGCQCAAPGRDEALRLLPVVIAEHLAWLDQHGDVTRDAFPFEVQVAEEVEVAGLAGVAEGEFCFQDDLRPVRREELASGLRRLGYARQDLLAAVRHLPDEVLDWEPPSGGAAADESTPGARSIRRILSHIARSDNYYAGNIGDGEWRRSGPGSPPDIFEERQRARERLRSLSDAELAGSWERRQPWAAQGVEQWSVRKVLRRMIAHERFHTREIEQTLAWLLLGAPVPDRGKVGTP